MTLQLIDEKLFSDFKELSTLYSLMTFTETDLNFFYNDLKREIIAKWKAECPE